MFRIIKPCPRCKKPMDYNPQYPVSWECICGEIIYPEDETNRGYGPLPEGWNIGQKEGRHYMKEMIKKDGNRRGD